MAALLLLSSRAVAAATLTVSWDAPPDPTVTGYLVSYGTQSGNYTASIDAANQTSVQISSLSGGTVYYFVVQSYDASRILSLPTPEVTATAPTAQTLNQPSITCPIIKVASPTGLPVAVTYTGLTVVGGTLPLTTACAPASGSLFSVGTTPFHCATTDATGLGSACDSTVTVTPPPSPDGTAMPPASSIVDATSHVWTLGAITSAGFYSILRDQMQYANAFGRGVLKCSGGIWVIGDDPTVVYYPVSGTAFGTAQTTAPCGASAPQPAPTPAPSIMCPVIAPATSSNGLPTSVTYAAPTVTNGAQPIVTTCTPSSGSLFAVGTTNVSCTASDALNRVASCSTSVVVQKAAVTPLGITCPVINTAVSTNGKSLSVSYPNPVVTGGVAPVTTACAPASGSKFSLGSTNVTCTAQDAASQVASCTTTVTVVRHH